MQDDVDNEAVAFFRRQTTSMNMTIAGKRVYMVHAQPPDDCHGGIKLLNREGEVQPDRVAFWTDELKTLIAMCWWSDILTRYSQNELGIFWW